MTLISPALGPIELSPNSEPRLFKLARVGLGALGVVTEVTLQCVDAHKLVQRTFTETRASAAANHSAHLAHQHMRYMWIPHTDTVVVVTCDPVPPGGIAEPLPSPADDGYATEPLRELLMKKAPDVKAEEARAMNFAQLR